MVKPSLDELVGAAGSASALKVLLELAESIPYPREDCGWFTATIFDFIQRLANNSTRKGVRRPVNSWSSWQPGAVTTPVTIPTMEPGPSGDPGLGVHDGPV